MGIAHDFFFFPPPINLGCIVTNLLIPKSFEVSALHNLQVASLPTIGFTSLFFSWYASSQWWRFLYLVVPFPSLPSLWPASLNPKPFWAFCLPGLLVLAQLVSFFLPFLGAFFFIQFGRVSSHFSSQLISAKQIHFVYDHYAGWWPPWTSTHVGDFTSFLIYFFIYLVSLFR